VSPVSPVSTEGRRDLAFGPNPVLGREVVERMRSVRTVVILVVYLAVLAGLLYVTYRIGLLILRDSGFQGGGLGAPSIGRMMFETLLMALTFLIAFIVPGTAAGAIAGENERRTLPLLQVTLLSPRAIVFGKLGASLAFALLLVIATAPLFAIPLVLGGVSVWQVIKGLLVLISLSVFLASLALLMSSLARRVQFATVNAYALTFFVLFGTLMLWGVEALFRSEVFGNPGRPVSVYFNPIVAVADAVGDTAGFDFAPSPLTGIKGGLTSQIRNAQAAPGGGLAFQRGGAVVRSVPAQPALPPPQLPPAQRNATAQPQTKVEVASGEINGIGWTFSAFAQGEDSCAELASAGGIEVSCARDGGDLLVSSASVGGETLVFGQVPKEANKVRVELTGSDRPAEVDPIAKEGFETNFYVHQVGSLRASAVVAVADDGTELLRRTVPPDFEEPPVPNANVNLRQGIGPERVTTFVWPVHVALLWLFSVLFLEAARRRIHTPSQKMVAVAGTSSG
jgi:ABC-type transport system involved in multi-copper enzyme maturation permease subunit